LFKAASASALLNAFLSSMQIALGLTAHSDGLFADGIHTLSDLAADAIVLIVLYLSAKSRSARHAHAPHNPDNSVEHSLASLFHSISVAVTISTTAMNSDASECSTLLSGLCGACA
jgi:divalent metal cation (Fe/Co/Zn/Cd) transporter